MYLAQFGLNVKDGHFTSDELRYIDDQLKHKTEINLNKFDEWGNYDENFMLNTDSPYLDEFILKKMKGPNALKWPENKPFAVCLTHDVDRVKAYSPESFLRNLKKRLLFTDSQTEKLMIRLQILKTGIKSFFYKNGPDEISGYEKWSILENEFGVKSTYFFYVRPSLKNLELFDCDYTLDDQFLYDSRIVTVKEYIKILFNSGAEIGLHGSFKSALDKSIFMEQKKTLESIIDEEIISTRQHYLRYDHQQTPLVHMESGIEIDSTLGLNKFVGFRSGTSYPYPIEVNGKVVWELPLIFMDSSIYSDKSIDIKIAQNKIMDIIDKIEKTGGCLTINFHPDYVNIPDYFNLYRFILTETTKRNAYFGTAKDIINVVRTCVE